jgi:hypothetical protein
VAGPLSPPLGVQGNPPPQACSCLGLGVGGRPGSSTSRWTQSRKRWQAFFQRQAVHHRSRWSMPYTFRHFLASPRGFLGDQQEEWSVAGWDPPH